MIHRQILTCLFLLALLPLSAKAFPPASPAGGNYLVLDGVDDHAVLDFETFGRPLPNGTEEFTVEAWIYPTTPPDNGNTLLTILHQQVHMLIVNDDFQPWLNEVANLLNIEPPKGDLILIMNAYIDGKFGLRLASPIPLVPNQWHHVAYQSNGDQTTMIVNDFVWIRPLGDPLGHDNDPRALRPLDFVLGGFGKIVQDFGSFWGSFTGYIDEVRISTIPRYDVEKKALCQTVGSKMTQRQLRCGILMSRVEHGNSQTHQAMRIIWRVKMAREPAFHLQSNQKENSQPHGDDLSNETALFCVKEMVYYLAYVFYPSMEIGKD